MDKKDIEFFIYQLRKNKYKIKEMGVKKIGLFGSVVKGNLKKDSDIDLIVEFEKGKATFENVGKLIEFLR
ncbi:MAG: nucleotidyltransferase, partial [Candidatus Nanohaloarchaeota archaeon]|nr:nucleotidyltransferase [Candidatus Nanohaloarchaeota archaeon]